MVVRRRRADRLFRAGDRSRCNLVRCHLDLAHAAPARGASWLEWNAAALLRRGVGTRTVVAADGAASLVYARSAGGACNSTAVTRSWRACERRHVVPVSSRAPAARYCTGLHDELWTPARRH